MGEAPPRMVGQRRWRRRSDSVYDAPAAGTLGVREPDRGGFTVGRILSAAAYHHVYNPSVVSRMFRLRFAARAFRLSEQVPSPRAQRVPAPCQSANTPLCIRLQG